MSVDSIEAFLNHIIFRLLNCSNQIFDLSADMNMVDLTDEVRSDVKRYVHLLNDF